MQFAYILNMQHTLTNSVIFKGKGLHSGLPVMMTVSPALANEGIRFIRKDIDDNNVIPAQYDLVEQSQLCTRLRNKDNVTISTVEHVMAALVGCGIDNATIIVDGPEIPIMDGSSLPFVEAFQNIGVQPLGTKRHAIRVLKDIEVHGEDGAYAKFTPDTQSSFEFTIDFDNRFIGRQNMEFTLGDHNAFLNELADSPTFTTKNQIEQLRSLGLIKGGDHTNADVYAEDAVYRDKSRPRKDQAAVRHKILDAVGDCGLAGAPIYGRYVGYKAGHAITNKLLHALFADKNAYTIVTDELGIAQPSHIHQSENAKLAYNA